MRAGVWWLLGVCATLCAYGPAAPAQAAPNAPTAPAQTAPNAPAAPAQVAPNAPAGPTEPQPHAPGNPGSKPQPNTPDKPSPPDKPSRKPQPDAPDKPEPKPQPRAPWCAPELEALDGDVCFFAAKAKPGVKRRTLVIFLHGWVQDGLAWQHAQQRAIVRGARRHGFSVITPRGRAGASTRGGPQTVSWPTSPKMQARYESALLAEWRAAREAIEARQGAAFDEVFVTGFSNGAYYASSLAMRGRLDVDGYAMFAGGSAYAPRAPKDKRAPIFLGICSRDSTKKRARQLDKQLRRARWPHRTETRKVGHTMADAHLDHAIGYLRAQAKQRRAP